jgi:glutathione peroxidase
MKTHAIKSLGIAALALWAFWGGAQESPFYGFTVKDIDGKDFAFSQLKGKKVLVVNVASKCGLTPQYAALQSLYEKYGNGGTNFVIVAFPANDFGKQEPGSHEEIKAFCSTTYHVTFPMMAKISVKGEGTHPLYRWLTDRSQNGVTNAPVAWNFQKFLVDADGRLVSVVSPRAKPDSETIIRWLETKTE